jgi:subtilisin family serine protease
MARPSLRRQAALVITSSALVVASALGGSAMAAPTPEPLSTPVPISTPDGLLMSYVVNVNAAGPARTLLAEAAVRDAGGTVVQSWDKIGVIVAHSSKAAFRSDVVRLAKGQAVESVGATRTVAVTEGTPSLAGSLPKSHSPATTKKGGLTEQSQVTIPALDPREGEQWDMAQIKADKAHAVTDGSRSVVVGVLDSGIESKHPDLAPNFDAADSVSCIGAGRPDTTPANWEPTTSDHGTHVAGTIAAARNGIGIVGVAPNVRLASVKVVNDAGFIYPEYAVCGFMWAGMKKMDVTNNSYFVDPFMFYCEDQPDQAAAKEAVRRAVQWSEKQGVVSAAAAGNSNEDMAHKTTDTTSPDDQPPSGQVSRTINNSCNDIPTELPGVVTVAATTQAGDKAPFSNLGMGVIDVAAPGANILSTVTGGAYGLKSGTSMASPHVAGVLALLKSTHPTATPARLVRMLRAEADDRACPLTEPRCTGTTMDNAFFGEGIADALDAVGGGGGALDADG